MDNLPPFYTDLLTRWKNTKKIRKIDEINISQILNEPLFYNPNILHPITKEPLLIDQFISAGITKVIDLLNTQRNAFITAPELSNKVNIHSQRILTVTLNTIHKAIPNLWMDRIITQLEPENDYIVQDIHQNYELHTSDDLSLPLYKFQKGSIYKHLSLALHNTRWPDRLDTVWRDLLDIPKDTKPNFKDCYSPLLSVYEGDLQWRISHGAYATENFRYQIGFNNTGNCLFCTENDSLLHTFYECHQNDPLLNFIKSLLNKFPSKPKVPPWWFVINPPKKSREFNTKYEFKLFLYVIGIAKLSIYLSRRNKRENSPFTEPLEIFKTKITARLKHEFAYHNLTHQKDLFLDTWACDEILCTISQTNDLKVLI